MDLFTVKFIESLKAGQKPGKTAPDGKPYTVREGKGFGIRVFPSGGKTWIFTYKLNGQQRMYKIAKYDDMTLKDARKEHGRLREILAGGVDPLSQKEAAKTEWTVSHAVEKYLSNFEDEKKRSIYEERRILTTYIPKTWKHKKVNSITRKEIKSLSDKMRPNAPHMAAQFLKAMTRFFNYLILEDGVDVEQNPCTLIKRAKYVERDRFLSPKEIQTFWTSLDMWTSSIGIKKALMLILVTAQRPGEVISMHHDNIDGNWWTIPSEKSKNEKSHRVYLTDLALEIIGNGTGYVFNSPKKKGSHITRQALSQAVILHDYFKLERWTPHDLRRSAASNMTDDSETTRFIVSLILNHTDKGITKVYDRNSYDSQKKAAMIIWSRRLMRIVEGKQDKKVISITGQ